MRKHEQKSGIHTYGKAISEIMQSITHYDHISYGCTGSWHLVAMTMTFFKVKVIAERLKAGRDRGRGLRCQHGCLENIIIKPKQSFTKNLNKRYHN